MVRALDKGNAVALVADYQAGVTYPQLAAKYFVSVNTAYHYVRASGAVQYRVHNKLDKQSIDDVLYLCRLGHSRSRIAKETGLSSNQVQYIVHRYSGNGALPWHQGGKDGHEAHF